jgi:hypothetical protein
MLGELHAGCAIGVVPARHRVRFLAFHSWKYDLLIVTAEYTSPQMQTTCLVGSLRCSISLKKGDAL